MVYSACIIYKPQIGSHCQEQYALAYKDLLGNTQDKTGCRCFQTWDRVVARIV